MALHPPHSPQPESFTPPDSPRLAVLPQPLAVYLLVQALTRVLQQTQTKSAGKTETIQPKATETPKSEEPTEKNLPGRASKLEYKTVNEMYWPLSSATTFVYSLTREHSWDQSNGYKIEEATNTKKDVEEMDQYVFVLRKKFGTTCEGIFHSTRLTLLRQVEYGLHVLPRHQVGGLTRRIEGGLEGRPGNQPLR